SIQPGHPGILLPCHGAAHDGPGRLRAGVRRRAELPHDELWCRRSPGAHDPRRFRARTHRAVDHGGGGGGGDARLVAEQLLAALPSRPDSEKPFHTAENLARISAFDIALDFEAAHTPRTVDPRA